MKKLLLSSIVLLTFSCSILIFQVSCSKDAVARPTNAITRIVYMKAPIGNFNGPFEIWVADSDGSNASQLPITVPGWRINNFKLSADGDKIYFSGMDSATGINQAIETFSANIDGSNVQQITHDNSSGNSTFLQDAN